MIIILISEGSASSNANREGCSCPQLSISHFGVSRIAHTVAASDLESFAASLTGSYMVGNWRKDKEGPGSHFCSEGPGTGKAEVSFSSLV